MSAALALAAVLWAQALPPERGRAEGGSLPGEQDLAEGGTLSAEQALAEGRFEQALELYDQAGDGLERARGRADVFYRARDPESALREARAGLREHPTDLHLLLRACGAGLWLADGATAGDFGARLQRAVAATDLAPDERQAWEAATAPLVSQALELSAGEDARAQAVARARAVVLAALALTALAFVSLLASGARRAPRPAPRASPPTRAPGRS